MCLTVSWRVLASGWDKVTFLYSAVPMVVCSTRLTNCRTPTQAFPKGRWLTIPSPMPGAMQGKHHRIGHYHGGPMGWCSNYGQR